MKRKLLSLLVLLMTAATGAWAEGYYNININFDSVYNPEFTFFICDVMGPDMPSGTLDLSIDNSYTGSFRVDNGMCSSEIHSLDAGDHTWYAEFIPDGGGEKSTEERSFTIDQDFAYVYIDDPGQSSIEMGVGEIRNFRGHVDGPESSEVNISSSNDNVAKFRASSSFSYGFEGYIDAVGAGTATITVSFAGNKNYKAAQSKTLTVTVWPAIDVTANEGDAAGEYWATYYNSVMGYTADANTTVYKAAMNGTSSLTLTEVADIPAGQAVILKSSSASITLTPAASTTADLSDNVLLGGTSVTSGYDAYTLSRGADGTGTVGFYKFNGGALDGSKAHLEISSSSPAPARGFFGFGDDGTTAIEAPTATIIVEDGEIYDLMGRRIEGQPTRKGIYVKNGQKFIVK